VAGRRVAFAIIGLVVVTKLPTLYVPAYGDEMAWFGGKKSAPS